MIQIFTQENHVAKQKWLERSLPVRIIGQRTLFLWFCAVWLLTACSQGPTPDSSTAPATLTASPVEPVATQAEPTETPTATSLILPTADYSRLPDLSPAGSETSPRIEQFQIMAVDDLPSGKRISLSWKSDGAGARLIAGTQLASPPWWQLPPTGEMTIELTDSMVPDPLLTLQVFDVADVTTATSVSEAVISLQWPCSFSYFFEPAPEPCPAEDALAGPAAEQPFENGVMIWIDQLDSVFVLTRQDQSWRRYDDTWSEEQPESDPTISPPEGRYQPIRGFGKVWREQPAVREQLGWALGPELGFESTIQNQMVEANDDPILFVKTFNEQVFALIEREPDRGEWVIASS